MNFGSILETIAQVEKDYNDTHKEAIKKNNMLSFFGLEKNPFIDAIDTSFFFQTKNHEEAFLKMLMCVEDDISLGLVYAESGLGKTMLSQIFLYNIDQTKYKPVLILVSPKMSRSALLKEICLELGLVKKDEKLFPQDLLNLLQEHAVALYKKGQKLVLIFDEAHFLTSDSLHTIRTISNIEVPEKKLTTCLLIGEEGLWQRLQKDTYKAIRSRIYQVINIQPLTEEETIDYIKFRILIAGGKPEVFDKQTYKNIHEKSKGICRDINKFCYNLLVNRYLALNSKRSAE